MARMHRIVLQPSGSVEEHIRDYRVCYFKDEHLRTFFEMHQHSYYEILLHCGGGFQFSGDLKIYDMKPRDVYVVPPFLVHGLIGQERLNNYERLFLHITGTMLDQLGFGVIDLKEILDRHMQRQHYRLSLSEEQFGQLRSLLTGLYDRTEPLSPYEELENRLALASFVQRLCRCFEETEGFSTSSRSTSLPYMILDHINNHFTGECSLESIADRFSTSKYNVVHCFSSEFQTSPYQYLLFRRISLARELIRKNEPLTSVAFQCGFNDYSNFLRAFVRITGMCPREYRKSSAE